MEIQAASHRQQIPRCIPAGGGPYGQVQEYRDEAQEDRDEGERRRQEAGVVKKPASANNKICSNAYVKAINKYKTECIKRGAAMDDNVKKKRAQTAGKAAVLAAAVWPSVGRSSC